MAGNYETTFNPNENQPGPAEGFNLDAVQKVFGAQAEKLDQNLKTRMESMDPNSTQDMVNFQVEFNKYMIVEGLRSGIIKSIKDTIQSIIQKI
ncbi:MAG: EscF/YscF/HrpA family type III secretion system needle major subunit [Candidatus Endonucleobacter bathymodioli]|uniref:EscF/YscF/HrpA family type III secretion system needle major subunit n=1 Tax=Candidatus Endonucleibacter bathymodioli TaxID=539814 RepID=A0AA90NS68_9GAMM|nr:EscF/YscF/HrpA family type III secretion system needle major subunit [Candidatus Endonucleobacter bathymodioli]